MGRQRHGGRGRLQQHLSLGNVMIPRGFRETGDVCQPAHEVECWLQLRPSLQCPLQQLPSSCAEQYPSRTDGLGHLLGVTSVVSVTQTTHKAKHRGGGTPGNLPAGSGFGMLFKPPQPHPGAEKEALRACGQVGDAAAAGEHLVQPPTGSGGCGDGSAVGPEVSPSCCPCKNRPGTALSLTDLPPPPAQPSSTAAPRPSVMGCELQAPVPGDSTELPCAGGCPELGLGALRSTTSKGSPCAASFPGSPRAHVPVPLCGQHPWVPRGRAGGLGMGRRCLPGDGSADGQLCIAGAIPARCRARAEERAHARSCHLVWGPEVKGAT